MKAKVLGWFAPLVFFGVAASIGAGVLRAPYSQPQQAPPAKGAPPAAKGAPAVNKEEEDAYKAVFAARGGSPATQIQLGEDFSKKFPESHYLAGVYSQLT